VLGTVTALVLALVFGGAWFAQWRGLFGSGSSPSSAPSVDAALFVAAPEDLGSVNPQATWQIATTTSTIDATTPQAKCLPSTAEDAQQPQDTLVRTFSSDGATAGAVLFQVNRYDTAETAQTAYAALLSELANCDRTTVWAVRGLAIQGLADEAAGQVFEVQDATNEFHTIALARTGTRVSIIDATQAQSAVSGDAVVGVLSAVGKRQCTDGGTCPTTPATTEIAPLTTTPAGWLATVDLPRISPGSGAWRATDVADSVTTPGTKCEAVDLTNLPGAASRQQRTYLLRDDTAAPQSFGVDEAVYTFDSPEECLRPPDDAQQQHGRLRDASGHRAGDPYGGSESVPGPAAPGWWYSAWTSSRRLRSSAARPWSPVPGSSTWWPTRATASTSPTRPGTS
jgi:hypothetical protein